MTVYFAPHLLILLVLSTFRDSSNRVPVPHFQQLLILLQQSGIHSLEFLANKLIVRHSVGLYCYLTFFVLWWAAFSFLSSYSKQKQLQLHSLRLYFRQH